LLYGRISKFIGDSIMFEILFHYPAVLARHRAAPLAPERERFLKHCADGGTAHKTLLRFASELRIVAEYVPINEARSVSVAQIETAANRWIAHQRHRRRIGRQAKFCRELFTQVATAWLRFLGRLETPVVRSSPHAALIGEFATYMTNERGLSRHTVRGRCWQVQTFLHWLAQRGVSLADCRLEQVDTFLALKRHSGWCRISMATAAKALRAFFRYAGQQGWCAAHLAAGIQGPRLFRQETLPVGPSWLDVHRVIASADTDSPADIRDRAVLLLLAVYGLREGEVVSLTLDDVHWEQHILRVTRPKQRRQQDYPLTDTVGEAILRYLRQVRPRCSSRALFITLRAPFRPLVANSLYNIVSTRLRAAAVACRKHGPHALRHACAAHLVAEGFSLKQIGDHLGHRSAYATRTYAKVDIAGLRQVANFDLGDLQ
jgi:integrase/recombinase XerD